MNRLFFSFALFLIATYRIILLEITEKQSFIIGVKTAISQKTWFTSFIAEWGISSHIKGKIRQRRNIKVIRGLKKQTDMLSAYPSWLCFKVREACLSWLSSRRNRVRLYPVWIPFRRRLCFWHSPGTPFRKSSFRSGCWKTCGCWIRLHLTVLSCRPVWFLLSFLSVLIVWKSVFYFPLFELRAVFSTFWGIRRMKQLVS